MITSIPSCPILHPTQDEFRDFYTYMQKVEEKYAANYGMVKVIPPKNEKFTSTPIDNIISSSLI